MPRLAAPLALLVPLLLSGCGRPSEFWTEHIFNRGHELGEDTPFEDFEFRICKAGDTSSEMPDVELQLQTSSAHQGGELLVLQWPTRTQYEADAPPQERGRIGVGESAEIELSAAVAFDEPGDTCGPWNVFRIALEPVEDAQRVAYGGSLIVGFAPTDRPFDDFRVEMLRQ
jgi:hypothetical protein